MKHSIFTLMLVVLFGLTLSSAAAQIDEDRAEIEAANKTLVLDFIDEVFNEGNIESAGNYASEEYIQNSPGTPSGLPVLQGFVEALHMAFPDIQYEVYQIGADGNLVAARIVIRGTQEGEFMGIPATGRQVAAATVNFWRVEDGVITEHWEVLDSLSFLQQLGVIPGAEDQPLPEFDGEPITEIPVSEVSDEVRAENTALVESLFSDVVNVQDASAAENIVAEEFVWHTGFAAPGLEGFQQFYGVIFEAFPDVERTIEASVADGDLVFVYNVITGTHEGGEQLYGVPPTGNPINYLSADVFRVEAGLIVELWDVADYLTLFQQIGLMPAAQ